MKNDHIDNLCTLNFAAGLTFLICLIPGISNASDGEEIYDSHCAICHATGVSNAPKIGDTEEWESRGSMKKLIHTAITGIGAMPPKGGCNSCTKEDLEAAIEYMK